VWITLTTITAIMSQHYSRGNLTLQNLVGIAPEHISMIQSDQAAYQINKFEKIII